MKLQDTVAILSGVEYLVVVRREDSYYLLVGYTYMPNCGQGKMVELCKGGHQL
jgi:hypothetical protein